MLMPILSSKRQITLPKVLCDRLGVLPGDDLEIFEHAGRLTIVKKIKGRSHGALKHLKADKRYSEAESLHDALASKSARPVKRRVA